MSRLVLFTIVFCLSTSLVVADHQLIVVEDEDATEPEEYHSSKSKPVKIFHATKEWKEIHGEILPKGLHVRVNLATGKKEAKLLDNMDDVDINSQITTKYQIAYEPPKRHVLLTESEDEFLKEIHKADLKKPGKPRNTTVDVESEKIILKNLLFRYNQTKDIDEKISILIDLEYFTHTGDLGKDFLDHHGFDVLMKDLNQTENQLMIEILSVFGAAIQSNAYVKLNLSGTDFLAKMIALIQKPNLHVDTVRKGFFVISTLLRNSIIEQAKFFGHHDGLELLKKLFQQDQKLAVRIVTLLSDITYEILNDTSHRYDLDRRKTIKSHYMDSELCKNAIQLLNQDLDRSNLMLLLESMIGITMVCRNEFLKNIAIIHETKDNVANQNEPIVQELIEKLLKNLKNLKILYKKDEL